jgi:hypothetical protein
MRADTHRTTVRDTTGHVRSTLMDQTGRTLSLYRECLSGGPVSGPEEGKELQDVPYQPDIMTGVNAISYDFRRRRGRLYLPDLCCVDMDACIRRFTGLDADCQRIETIAGSQPDTIYARGPHGWVAIGPRER